MIQEPTLLLDTERCKDNIATMCAKAKRHHVAFRPHFKTHQSLEIGRWFKAEGVDRITVSSLAMAAYFATEWEDITVAFPVNILEIDRINELAAKIKLNLLVEDEATAIALVEQVHHPIGIFIKIDVGYGRTGILPENKQQIDKLLDAIAVATKLHFRGFLAHAGHSYQCRTKEEILQVHEHSKAPLLRLKQLYISQYPSLILSYGDTPTCSVAENFEGLDELRPGNFVFYDLTQTRIGSNSIDQIAVAMACPIVAVHPKRSELIVYGGGVHFSKDRLDDEAEGRVFGRVVRQQKSGWGTLIPGAYVRSLSQEHGIVVVPPGEIEKYKIGDILLVLPVHSCMAANAMKSYQTLNGQRIDRL